VKAQDIKVGGHYTAKVNENLVTVRVDAIRGESKCGVPTGPYDVTNLKTGRKTTFRSAAKFRGPAESPEERAAREKRMAEDIDRHNAELDRTTRINSLTGMREPVEVEQQEDVPAHHLGRSFVPAEDGGTGPRKSSIEPEVEQSPPLRNNLVGKWHEEGIQQRNREAD
jgi:hypothetical protein